MEWLMGKARGVGRGLMNTSASSSNVTTSSSNPSESQSTLSVPSAPPYLNDSFLRQQLSLASSANTPIDFPELVEPQHPLEVDEWIAVHTIGLVENLCSIFDPLYELCQCRAVSSNDNVNSLKSLEDTELADPCLQLKKPARQVISLLLSECNDAIQSARIFPVKQGQAFLRADLRDEAAKICRKLLLCLVHIYVAHIGHLEQLDLVAHMNTIAKHFFAFTSQFELIDEDSSALNALNGFHRLLLKTPAPNSIHSGQIANAVTPVTESPKASSKYGVITVSDDPHTASMA